jgi:hypothetical protein
VPGTALLAAVIDIVEVVPLVLVVAGLKDTVTFAGLPVTPKVTAPTNPDRVSVTFEVFTAPP